jgi:hypothetical protein
MSLSNVYTSALIYHPYIFSREQQVISIMSDITDYLKQKIVDVRFARFIGEVVWAIGSMISITALFWKVLELIITGFSLLFLGLYLSVHYEFQRLDYAHALEKISHREN